MPRSSDTTLAFLPPERWPRPVLALIHGAGPEADLHLAVGLSDDLAEVPHPGCWRSLAELDPAALDPASHDQITRVAGRYGPLTSLGWEPGEGEPVNLWRELINDLRPLAGAWNKEGAHSKREEVAKAQTAALALHEASLSRHMTAGGGFVPRGFGLAMQCLDLGSYWRRSAIADVAALPLMRRCRWCGVWLSSRDRRQDASFCVPAHRSAFHQKRVRRFNFWAQA